jgi:DNA-binding CsgD family transcriptional regulator
VPLADVIGRDAEREAIRSFLDLSRPAIATIHGEAGIGKTTLWDFATRAASARGDLVLAWRAGGAERELAFTALMGLLDADPTVAPRLGTVLAGLAPPRARALAVALGREEARGASPDPSLVGLAAVDILRALTNGAAPTDRPAPPDRTATTDRGAFTPLVVAIDDAQWCDPASVDALAFAARRLRSEPIAFVLAVRTGSTAPGVEAIERALPEAARTTIEVGPLTVGALGRLIHDRLGVAHPRPLLVRIHEASAGNPFVALEMSRSLQRRGVAPAPGEPFPVSPQAGPLIRDHLRTLSEPARDTLLIVAMASQPTVGLVDRALRTDAAAAVDEACRSGVLLAEGDRLRAAHPLYASTAYADALPGHRRELRRALAEAIDDPLERAIQRAATVDGRDPAVADELESAARLAVARGAPSVAADLFAQAAGIAPETDGVALRMDAAASRLRAGDAEGAAELLRATLPSVPGGPQRARVLLALGEIVYLDSPPDALPLLREALDHSGGDEILTATAHLSIAIMSDADPSLGERHAEAAVEVLERPGLDPAPDPDLLASALIERAYQWLLRSRWLALEDVDRGMGLLSGAGDSFIARSAQERAERFLYHVGRLRESLAFDEAEYRRIVARGQVGLLPPIVQSMSVLELLIGDWPAARRHARECEELVEGGEEVWRERAIMARSRVLAWDGELDAARALALDSLTRQEAAGDRWEAVIFCALLGFIELSVPDPPAALAYLRRANAYADTLRVTLPTVFRYLGDLVEAAVLSGDLELAEATLVERLEQPAERIPLPWSLEVAARGRGYLCAARGQPDEAVAWFDRSLEVLETTVLPFERGRSLLARGQVQLRAGRRRLARADLEAAATIFGELGAAAWAKRTTADLARIGGRTASRWELTPSERSVAELAAAGRTNREIADQLVLSVRTVESHLAAAYRKLGVRSRVELVTALAKAGEASSEG